MVRDVLTISEREKGKNRWKKDGTERERNSECMFSFADFAKTKDLQNAARVQTLISL